MKVVSICNHGLVYLKADNLSSTIVEYKEKKVGIDTLYYKKYSDGTYSFGLIQGAESQFGHTKGYVWSSRASVINKYFGLKITEVGINGVCRAMPVSMLESLLPKDFYIQAEKFGNGEKRYAVYPVTNKDSRILYNMEVICSQ